MKIARIETFCQQEAGLVRVTADNGAQGWGQVSTYHADISALILHRQVAPWALDARLRRRPLITYAHIFLPVSINFPALIYAARWAG